LRSFFPHGIQVVAVCDDGDGAAGRAGQLA